MESTKEDGSFSYFAIGDGWTAGLAPHSTESLSAYSEFVGQYKGTVSQGFGAEDLTAEGVLNPDWRSVHVQPIPVLGRSPVPISWFDAGVAPRLRGVDVASLAFGLSEIQSGTGVKAAKFIDHVEKLGDALLDWGVRSVMLICPFKSPALSEHCLGLLDDYRDAEVELCREREDFILGPDLREIVEVDIHFAGSDFSHPNQAFHWAIADAVIDALPWQVKPETKRREVA